MPSSRIPHRCGILHRSLVRLPLLVLAIVLTACGSDQGPRVDPLVAPQVLAPPPAQLYTDEGADVRVRFRRESGGPVAGLPVTVSGTGTFSGATETDAAGEVRGAWRPAVLGPATLSVAVEGQVARLNTEVVSRQVVALTLGIPESATAGAPFVVTITGRDGKGVPPTSGSTGSIELTGGESGPMTLPLDPAGAEAELALTAAGARTLRAVHSAGASAEQTIMVQADRPAELEFMDQGPIGREDDVGIRVPTLYARDRFGNVYSGTTDWTVGGRVQAWPGVAAFQNGAFTPDSVRLGSGTGAGVFRVFGGQDSGSPFSVEASLPVLPRVGVTQVATSGLPAVAFTDAPVVFAFSATGPGGAVAFGRWQVSLESSSGASFGASFGGEGGVLDAEGQSGPIALGLLPVGTHDLGIQVDDQLFARTLTIREPPVPSALQVVSGDAQVAREGTTLAPLVIRVLDQEDEGIEASVSWSTTSGTLSGATVSDASGEALATWTLPMAPGAHEARARVGTLEVVFTATATETPVITEFRLVSGDAQDVAQGGTAPLPLVVEARDQFGAPISVPIQWTGNGELTPLASSTSAATGRAEAMWTVPNAPGTAQAIASAGNRTVTFGATVVEAPFPATIEIVSGNGQGRLEGKTLESPLVVRVRDQFGDAIGGAVTWSGPGSFAPASSALSGAGVASTSWTLPSEVGEHTATATIGAVSVQFAGEVTDLRRPVRVDLVSGSGQTGLVSTQLPLPLRFRVFDQDDEPMAGALTPSGDGSFDPAGAQMAGSDGFAEFRWTLGSATGTQTASFASESDTIQVTAQATAVPAAHPLEIDGHYLVQTIQTEDRDRELVADRSALFRGFFRRSESGTFTARLHLRNSGGTVVETLTLDPPATLPTGTPDRMNQGTTFQVTVPASRITPGMSYILEVESDAGILADTVAPTVVPRGILPVRFVPVRVDSTGTVGNVTPGNLNDFVGRSDALPFRGVDPSVRAEFVYGGSPVTGSFDTWTPLLTQVRELRVADGSTDLYYGVVQREGGGGGVGGVGFVGFPVSLGLHSSSPASTQYIFNHEVGHNMSLSHAPCSVSPSDPNFPFPDGRIGAHGYFQGSVLAPTAPDVMGYCGGITFGTYHWSRAINFTMPTVVAAAGGGPAYRIWGSVSGGKVTLQSPYVGSDLVDAGVPSGPRVRITVRAEDGALLWSGDGPLMMFDHVDGGAFSVPVPVAVLGEDRRAMQIDVETLGLEIPDPGAGAGALGITLSRFAVGFDPEMPGLVPVPEGEVYRAPDGSVMGFGVRGVTRPPEGALIQDGTPAGLIRAPGTTGELGAVVGRVQDMLRGGGGS